jgi:hypothetical protein
MTMHAETRFVCDACADEAVKQTINSPMVTRASAPDGWTTMWLENYSDPPRHLCLTCSRTLTALMNGKPGK